MENYLTATAKIRGLKPLMWHVFGPESIPLDRQEKAGVAGNDPTEWKRTYTATKDGQLYFRGDYPFSMMVEAAKHTRVRRGSIQKNMQATLQILDDVILVNRYMFPDYLTTDDPPKDPTADVYVDVRSVKNPSTKARNVRYRVTARPGWELSFRLYWNKTVVSRGEMENVLHDAGLLVGIGDGRAIGMGRFEVVEFVVQDGNETAKQAPA